MKVVTDLNIYVVHTVSTLERKVLYKAKYIYTESILYVAMVITFKEVLQIHLSHRD